MATDRRGPRRPATRRNSATAVADAPCRGDRPVAPTTVPPDNADADFDGDLPEGWTAATLADLVADDAPIQYGILQPGPDTPGGIPYVRPTEIEADEIDIARLRRTTRRIADQYVRSSLRRGDVILSIVGTIGKVAIVPPGLGGANITQSSARLRPRPNLVSSACLAWLLRSPHARRTFRESELGTGVHRLNIGDIRQMRMPLPPLAEQKRIVAKVEEVLAHVNAARDHLTRVPALLKRFRQSILAAACSGRLTEDWRVRTPNTRQDAAVPQTAGCTDDFPDLPAAWAVQPLGSLFQVVTGSTPPKADAASYAMSESACPFFKPTDLDAGVAVRTAREWLSPRGVLLARVLPPKTVCVTSIGATIGKTGLLAVSGATNQQINSILPNPRAIPEFAYYYCISSDFQHRIVEASSSTTLPIINKSRFMELEFPLPPLTEQAEIVRRVDALFALADSIEQRVADATARANALTQATLAKAFRGELVPTEGALGRPRGADLSR